MQQLSAQDAQFLYMETNKSHSQVTSVAIFDPSTAPGGEVRFKQIIDHVQSRLHTSPIYRRRIYHVPLELDYPYWIDDEHFDIEYHISHGRLPHPSDWRQLCIHLARFHSRPLDLQRAPWEMFVIEGLDNVQGIPKGCYALATKIHHAAADGASIMNFFGGLLDMDQNGTPVMPVKQKTTSARFERPTPAQMTIRGMLSGLKSPVKVADTLLRTAPAIVQAARKSFAERRESDKRSVPQTRFNLETSPHRVFDATSYRLSEFKPIRTLSEGCTINDVVLAVCSGALRKYLTHHKELPTETLRAFCPINVRPKDGGDATPGNNISTMSPSLYTDIADPVERLQAIHAETKNQKAAKKGLSARLMTDITRHIPASTQLLAARMLASSELAGRMTNLCISNVPGPAIPTYMNGAKQLQGYGLGPLADRMGLFIAVGSFNGNMTFNITSCRRTMPDIDFFIECIRESFAELKQAAKQLPKTPPASNKPKAKKVTKKKKTVAKKQAAKAPAAGKRAPVARKKAPAASNRKKRQSKKVSVKKVSANKT